MPRHILTNNNNKKINIKNYYLFMISFEFFFVFFVGLLGFTKYSNFLFYFLQLKNRLFMTVMLVTFNILY